MKVTASVLFGQLQYNNAFGTAWGLRPTFAYARGMDGRSPSPAGSFIEDNESMSLALNADYQSEWTDELSYTALRRRFVQPECGPRLHLAQHILRVLTSVRRRRAGAAPATSRKERK